MDEEYNGWPNYETWLVNSYLLNNEDSLEELVEIMGKKFVVDKEDALKELVKDMINSSITNNNEEFRRGFATELLFDFGVVSDLLQSALDRVRWDEIIRANSEQ